MARQSGSATPPSTRLASTRTKRAVSAMETSGPRPGTRSTSRSTQVRTLACASSRGTAKPNATAAASQTSPCDRAARLTPSTRRVMGGRLEPASSNRVSNCGTTQ